MKFRALVGILLRRFEWYQDVQFKPMIGFEALEGSIFRRFEWYQDMHLNPMSGVRPTPGNVLLTLLFHSRECAVESLVPLQLVGGHQLRDARSLSEQGMRMLDRSINLFTPILLAVLTALDALVKDGRHESRQHPEPGKASGKHFTALPDEHRAGRRDPHF